MFNMPGIREGRRRLASSERGFSMGTVCGVLEEDGLASLDNPPFARSAKDGPPGFVAGPPGFVVGVPGFVAVWKRPASCWEAKVLEMDSL
jgi:hypothetical protein